MIDILNISVLFQGTENKHAIKGRMAGCPYSPGREIFNNPLRALIIALETSGFRGDCEKRD